MQYISQIVCDRCVCIGMCHTIGMSNHYPYTADFIWLGFRYPFVMDRKSRVYRNSLSPLDQANISIVCLELFFLCYIKFQGKPALLHVGVKPILPDA